MREISPRERPHLEPLLHLPARFQADARSQANARPLPARTRTGSVGCTSWGTSSGSCSACIGGSACSSSNPSSVTTTTAWTLYSDSSCSAAAIMISFPITADGVCRNLPLGGSIKVTNLTGAIVGGVVGGIVGLVLIIVAVIYCCRAQGAPCCVRCCGPPTAKGGVIIGVPQPGQQLYGNGQYPPGFVPPPATRSSV